MSNIKERILGAITVMSDEEAYAIWDLILQRFKCDMWNEIEITKPDQFDLQMLNDIKNNPDCHDFVSSEELKAQLGI